jgi:hypothetical protein
MALQKGGVGQKGIVETPKDGLTSQALCHKGFRPTQLYLNGPAPRPLKVADVNGDCTINLVDAIYLIRHLFRGGPAPLAGCVP